MRLLLQSEAHEGEEGCWMTERILRSGQRSNYRAGSRVNICLGATVNFPIFEAYTLFRRQAQQPQLLQPF